MRPTTQRIHWLRLGVATVVLLAGVAAVNLSSSPQSVPLTLSVGESVTLSVFRFFPGDSVDIVLGFDRDKPGRYDVTTDLGEWGPTEGTGFLEFESPASQ
jgi:hypothetical protein